MEPLAVVTAIVAVVVILARAPLVVAPEATIARYRQILATNTRLRVLAAVLAAIAAALVGSGHPGAGAGVATMRVIGWMCGGGAVWLALAPGSYRVVADSVLNAIDDPSTLRVLGAAGVAVGVGLFWLARFVL